MSKPHPLPLRVASGSPGDHGEDQVSLLSKSETVSRSEVNWFADFVTYVLLFCPLSYRITVGVKVKKEIVDAVMVIHVAPNSAIGGHSTLRHQC